MAGMETTIEVELTTEETTPLALTCCEKWLLLGFWSLSGLSWLSLYLRVHHGMAAAEDRATPLGAAPVHLGGRPPAVVLARPALRASVSAAHLSGRRVPLRVQGSLVLWILLFPAFHSAKKSYMIACTCLD